MTLPPIVPVVVAIGLALTPVRASATAPPDTEALAVWQHRAPGGDWDIWWSGLSRPSSDAKASQLAWSTPSGAPAAPIAVTAGDDENPQVTVQPGTSDAIAVWQSANGDGTHTISWSRRVGGAWSAPGAIATGADDVDPTVAIDDDGRALALWVRRAPAGDRLAWSRFDGAQWSAPGEIAGTTSPSLPELTFLATPGVSGHRAIVAFAGLVADPEPVMRTHVARFDGATWSAAEAIPLAADQRALIGEHGSGDYDVAYGAFARLDVGAEADGDAVVLWGGPVAEDLSTRYGSAGLMGARLDAEDLTWAPLRTGDGSPLLGGAGCKAPAVAMTGSEDLVAVFTSDGFLEHQRVTRATPGSEGVAYNTPYDDVRPSVAPLQDAVVVVATGLGYPDDVTPPSALTWSVGTLRPASAAGAASTTFAAPRTMTLPGEARYPSVASVLGGTENPLTVEMQGRGYAAGVDAAGEQVTHSDTGEVRSTAAGRDEAGIDVLPPNPLVRILGARAVSERGADTSRTTVAIAEVHLATVPPVVLRGLEVTASASCPEGRRGAVAIASIQVGADPPVGVDARQNTSVSLGALTVRVNEQTLSPRSATVRGLRLVGSGIDVTVGFAHAALAGCTGSGEPVATVPHDH